jgi:hypothetical protein
VNIAAYLDQVRNAYESGHATEHSYPPSPQVFRHVSKKGEQLRRLHLMEPGAIGEAPYSYEGKGDDMVASGFPKWESGKVHINEDQYFSNVPKLAWEFYIGGYQPAQKWLKDRPGAIALFRGHHALSADHQNPRRNRPHHE